MNKCARRLRLGVFCVSADPRPAKLSRGLNINQHGLIFVSENRSGAERMLERRMCVSEPERKCSRSVGSGVFGLSADSRPATLDRMLNDIQCDLISVLEYWSGNEGIFENRTGVSKHANNCSRRLR